jgi:hypothetical protein
LLYWHAANAAPRFLDHRKPITASPIIKVLQGKTDDLLGTAAGKMPALHPCEEILKSK